MVERRSSLRMPATIKKSPEMKKQISPISSKKNIFIALIYEGLCTNRELIENITNPVQISPNVML